MEACSLGLLALVAYIHLTGRVVSEDHDCQTGATSGLLHQRCRGDAYLVTQSLCVRFTIDDFCHRFAA